MQNYLCASPRAQSSPVPLPDLYFDSFSCPVFVLYFFKRWGHCFIHLSIVCWANHKLCLESYRLSQSTPMGSLHNPVTWYGINYARTQVTQWDFQNKGKSSLATSSRVFAHSQSPLSLGGKNKLSLWRSQFQHNLFLPCDRIVKRAYSTQRNRYNCAFEYLTRVKNIHGANFDTVSRQVW